MVSGIALGEFTGKAVPFANVVVRLGVLGLCFAVVFSVGVFVLGLWPLGPKSGNVAYKQMSCMCGSVGVFFLLFWNTFVGRI